MSRPAMIDDATLLERLGGVFRAVGYEAASLADLSEASGLQRASLYHRFPEGKEQMAREVLTSAAAWLKDSILDPLTSGAPPQKRVEVLVAHLDTFYAGGKKSCLLNLLSSPYVVDGPFSQHIKEAFEALISALAHVAKDAGLNAKLARTRAERVVALIQGSLVMCRSLGTTRPFANVLRQIPDELLRA